MFIFAAIELHGVQMREDKWMEDEHAAEHEHTPPNANAYNDLLTEMSTSQMPKHSKREHNDTANDTANATHATNLPNQVPVKDDVHIDVAKTNDTVDT